MGLILSTYKHSIEFDKISIKFDKMKEKVQEAKALLQEKSEILRRFLNNLKMDYLVITKSFRIIDCNNALYICLIWTKVEAVSDELLKVKK